MKRKIILSLSILVVISLVVVLFASTLNAATWKKDSKGTIIVESGTFDGGGKSYGGVGDGSQNESQPPVFTLRKGTNLKNCKIVPPAGDGIHVEGNNTIENVNFTDVGEDAISMGSSSKNGGTVTIRNCQFAKADDKVLQVNRESKWYIYDITVNGAGKVMRQNGGKTFPLTVYIDGLKATGVKEAVVRSDSPNCTVYYKNISCNLAKNKWWMGKLKAIDQGGSNNNNTPAPTATNNNNNNNNNNNTPTPTDNNQSNNGTVSATLTVVNEWGSGGQAKIIIKNNSSSATNGWSATVNVPGKISTIWNAKGSGSGNVKISNVDWNAKLQPGQSVEAGVVYSK